MNPALGPILILVGMVLLELIHFDMASRGVSEALQRRIERLGLRGAGLMGVSFGLRHIFHLF